MKKLSDDRFSVDFRPREGEDILCVLNDTTDFNQALAKLGMSRIPHPLGYQGAAMNGFDFFTQAIKPQEPEPPKRKPARKVVVANRKAKVKAAEASLANVAFLDRDEEIA